MWRFVDRELLERHPSGVRITPLSRRLQLTLVLIPVVLLLVVLLLAALAGSLYWLWQREVSRRAALEAVRGPIVEWIEQEVRERTHALEAARRELEERLVDLEAAMAREREQLRARLEQTELSAQRLKQELEALRAERAELVTRLEQMSAAVAKPETPSGGEPNRSALPSSQADVGARLLAERIEQLRRHLNTRTFELARARREREALSEQFRTALQSAERASERQRERFEAELERLRAQNRESVAELAALRHEAREPRAQASPAMATPASNERIAELTNERDQARARAQAAEAAAKALADELAAARQRIAELEAKAVEPAAGVAVAGEPAPAAQLQEAVSEEETAGGAGLFGSLAPMPPRPAPR